MESFVTKYERVEERRKRPARTRRMSRAEMRVRSTDRVEWILGSSSPSESELVGVSCGSLDFEPAVGRSLSSGEDILSAAVMVEPATELLNLVNVPRYYPRSFMLGVLQARRRTHHEHRTCGSMFATCRFLSYIGYIDDAIEPSICTHNIISLFKIMS